MGCGLDVTTGRAGGGIPPPKFSTMQRLLITVGIALAAVGVFWPWLAKIPLFRLPGDLVVNKPHLKIYVPVTSMVVLSVVVSLLFWIIRKLK